MPSKHLSITLAITASVAVAASYLWIDRPVADYFLTIRDGTVYGFFKALTVLGESQWYLAGGLLAWAFYRKRSARASQGGLFLFTSVATSGIAANLLKALLGRARPRLYFHESLYGFDPFHIEYAWLSFPSGHAATALGAATVLVLLFPRFKHLFLVTGFAIAISRIVLTQHYVGDVIAGSLLGALVTALLYRNHFRTSIDAEE